MINIYTESMPDNHYQTLGCSTEMLRQIKLKKPIENWRVNIALTSVKRLMLKRVCKRLMFRTTHLSDAEKKKQYDFELDHPQGFAGFNAGNQGGFDQSQFYRQSTTDGQHADLSGFEDFFGRFGQGFGGGDYQYQRANRQPRATVVKTDAPV